ncbi:conserved hypothetical protein [Burkholderia pseudomallei Pakistan 9]|nr:conserved hypothetical protein [Burkholderia pseudomallei Pakistan 9]VUD42177.1 unnamed protein product [Burkholderia pseudomallei]
MQGEALLRFSASPLLRFSASPLLRFSASPLLRFSASPLLRFSASPLRFSAPLLRARRSRSPMPPAAAARLRDFPTASMHRISPPSPLKPHRHPVTPPHRATLPRAANVPLSR